MIERRDRDSDPNTSGWEMSERTEGRGGMLFKDQLRMTRLAQLDRWGKGNDS